MMRGRSVLLFSALVAVFSASLGCNNVGDEECTPDSIANDRSDGCPYGNPGGPMVTESDCTTTLTPGLTACNGNTFDVVYKKMVVPAAQGGPGCADSGCHGQANAGGLHLDTDPVLSYKTLELYSGGKAHTYIDPGMPGATKQYSWIKCNADATEGGGNPMPPAGMTKALSSEIATWVACGVKPPP